jgi:hypothetical protein
MMWRAMSARPYSEAGSDKALPPGMLDADGNSMAAFEQRQREESYKATAVLNLRAGRALHSSTIQLNLSRC